jgi:hypothetical protein
MSEGFNIQERTREFFILKINLKKCCFRSLEERVFCTLNALYKMRVEKEDF